MLITVGQEEERRAAFGQQLKELRGSRRQVDIVEAVNVELENAGEEQRVSQGQYSAYERGLDRPHPTRLRAIERVHGLTPGHLTAILDGADLSSYGAGRAPGNDEDDPVMVAFRGLRRDLTDEEIQRLIGYGEGLREAKRQGP